MRKLLMISICAAVFTAWGVLFAQQAQIDQKLKEDVEIMETVLDKMFSSQPNFIPSVFSNSKGFYLKGYGVIFHVQSALPMQEIQIIMMRNMQKQLQGAYAVKEKRESVKEEQADFTERIEQTKEKIANFLGNYASSMRNLQADEKVAVVVDFKNAFPAVYWGAEQAPQQIVASVAVKDLQNFRRGNMSEAQFRKKINFEKVTAPSEDVSIFTNVIKTAMQHAGKKNDFRIDDEVQGIHFPGHGVFFLITFNFNHFFNHEAKLQKFQEFFEQAKAARGGNYKIGKQKNIDYQKQLESLENKLIDLLSNYGQTLRNVKANEWVEFGINFQSGTSDFGFSRSIIKVRKKAIDDFNRKKISFEQFKKNVAVIYY